MGWETASIFALVATSFYLIYLQDSIDRKHTTLRMFLMLTSFLSMLLTIGVAHEITINEALANNNIRDMMSTAYQVYVWLTIVFIAYWFLFVFGTIANNLWGRGRKNG